MRPSTFSLVALLLLCLVLTTRASGTTKCCKGDTVTYLEAKCTFDDAELNICRKGCQTTTWRSCCTETMKAESNSPCSPDFTAPGQGGPGGAGQSDNADDGNSDGSGNSVVIIVVVAAVVVVVVVLCGSMVFMATVMRPSAPVVEDKYRSESSNDVIVGTVVDGGWRGLGRWCWWRGRACGEVYHRLSHWSGLVGSDLLLIETKRSKAHGKRDIYSHSHHASLCGP